MEVCYKNKKIERTCTQVSVAIKKYGTEMALKINQRINEISAADNVDIMIQFGIGRCHPLKGNKKGCYAVDLVHPFRLLFTVKQKKVVIAVIEEIMDYH